MHDESESHTWQIKLMKLELELTKFKILSFVNFVGSSIQSMLKLFFLVFFFLLWNCIPHNQMSPSPLV